MSWLMFVLGLLVGTLIALRFVDRFYIRRSPIGMLRVDQSDPNEAPYLFLEVFPGGREAILTKDYVVLRVRREDFLPHE